MSTTPTSRSVRAPRAPWALTAAVTIAALLVAGLAGLLVGRWAGERASEPSVELLLIEDPTLAGGDAVEGWTSAGGFTGFGGLPALPGGVLRAASVVESAPGRLVVEAEGSTTTIQFLEPVRLFEIVPAPPIEAGDVIVVRLLDGVPEALLIVPRDLEEGTGLGGR